MQDISTCFWFDSNGEEAVDFYTSIFKNAKKHAVARYTKSAESQTGKKAGDVMTVEFEIGGRRFLALNGGPVFKISPSISLSYPCQSEEEINYLWRKLFDGGIEMMPLGAYPFSERYGWIQDKFGISWQLNLQSANKTLAPSMLFVGDAYGRAEDAMKFYASIFNDSKIEHIARYEKGESAHDPEGKVKYGLFRLMNQEFIAMDSGYAHAFKFDSAVSFVVDCDTQQEIDEYWHKFAADGGQEVQCGWVTDKFGVCWQVVPKVLNEMMKDNDEARRERVMGAMLKMVKLDLKQIQQAYDGIKASV